MRADPYEVFDGVASRIKVATGADVVTCTDCGCLVTDRAAHTRFHAILDSHAGALAALEVARLREGTP